MIMRVTRCISTKAARKLLIKSDLGNWIKVANTANVFVSKFLPELQQMTGDTPIFLTTSFITALENHKGVKFGQEF